MCVRIEAGEYEDGIEDNSTWEEGDWDGDLDFTTPDLVLALQTGLYEVKPELNASQILKKERIGGFTANLDLQLRTG